MNQGVVIGTTGGNWSVAVNPQGMRPVATCSHCGSRNLLARLVFAPTRFPLICAVCETPIEAIVTTADIANAITHPEPRGVK